MSNLSSKLSVVLTIASLAVGLGVATQPAWGESALQTKEQTFHGERLVVEGLRGRLRIEVEDRSDVAVQVRGVAADVRDVALDAQNGTVRILDRSSGGGSSVRSSSITVGSVTATGHAVVHIGGKDVSAEENHPALEITARIPVGLPLTLQVLSGNCEVGDSRGPVALTVAVGDCTLGAIGKAQLSIEGAGDIVVRQVSGDLEATVDGSGDIRVKNGQVEKLAVSLQGSGDITLGVTAKQAALRLQGSGDIRITEVRDRPTITLNGSGTVDIGNWP